MRRRRTPPALEIVTIRPTGLAPRPAERSPRPVPLRTGCRSGLPGVSRGPDDLSRRDQRETRPERRVGRKNPGRYAARLERRREIPRLGRRAGMDRPSATEAPVPALIAPCSGTCPPSQGSGTRESRRVDRPDSSSREMPLSPRPRSPAILSSPPRHSGVAPVMALRGLCGSERLKG
jgi:hypothetical protein